MAKKSEFGGEGMAKNTIHKNKLPGALSAVERRRLLMLTGTESPTAEPNPAWFNGERPDQEA